MESKELLERLQEDEVIFVSLQFTDITDQFGITGLGYKIVVKVSDTECRQVLPGMP